MTFDWAIGWFDLDTNREMHIGAVDVVRGFDVVLLACL